MLPTIKKSCFSFFKGSSYQFLVVSAATFVFYCSLHGRALSYLLVFPLCTGFGWGRVKFLHSTLCVALFWICVGNRVRNIEMLLLWQSKAYRASRQPFCFLTPSYK